MGTRLGAAGDMNGYALGSGDGRGKAGGVTARIDTGALAGRCPDASKDVQARVGGISDEAEHVNVTCDLLDSFWGNARQKQRAPGRRTQRAIAMPLGKLSEADQRGGLDAAKRQTHPKAACG